jgi:cytochrome c biogenesis protein CcdA
LGSAKAYAAVPSITPVIQAAATRANKLAYVKGAHLVFLVAMGLGFVACIAAFFTESIDERKYTNKTMAVIEQDHKKLEEKQRAGGA